jgi:hypothetical protein
MDGDTLGGGFNVRFDFARDPESHVRVDELVPGWGWDLDDDDDEEWEGYTLKERYAQCLPHCSSVLPERVLLTATLEHQYLLSQHCFLDLGQPTDQSALDQAIETGWNGVVRDVRRTLHWPRFRLLLLALRSADAGHTHSGLERLGPDLISTIGHHMLHGPKDTHGYEVSGSFHLPFDARPGYDELQNELEECGIASDDRKALRKAQIAQAMAMHEAMHQAHRGLLSVEGRSRLEP